MWRKDFEYIKSLDQKELKDYYACYHHHLHHRHNRELCTSAEIRSANQTIESNDCRCTCQQEHFCTCGDYQENQMAFNSSLSLCEHYKPSYTSKDDQLNNLNYSLMELKKSKSIKLQAMRDIDKLLDETDDTKHLSEVEKFYRSKNFIGSSLLITSKQATVPIEKIGPTTTAKYIHELNDLKGDKKIKFPRGNALFAHVPPPMRKKSSKNVIKKEIEINSRPITICRIKD